MTEEFRALAMKALVYVPDGGHVGLGSGRTTEAFIQLLGERVRQGFRVRGVATSEKSAQLARELGIFVGPLHYDSPLDVTIDGADEVERNTLNLVKGWGGALVRERIVAAAANRQIILVTAEKLVDRLGSRGNLPVEVLPFAAAFCRRKIEQIPADRPIIPAIRGGESSPFVSDNGNWIFDCSVPPLHDPAAFDRSLRAIPGVVDTGLFLGTAAAVLLAKDGAVQEFVRT